ncbi:hypothetical protein PVAND_005613 [Polypedilum vanderplanki]|uniref:Protein arginine N-methyltransferase n=1 Tax=Polypedilum vanderplanki TaxID=319348 RepID=A0A9J6C115_POLVA|nr:hypothetical protein PVAND_005613 [Polypedilum vanderplanki]
MGKQPEFHLKINECSDLQETFTIAKSKKCTSLVTKITNDEIKSSPLNDNSSECFVRSPLILTASQWVDVLPIVTFSSCLSSQNDFIKEECEQNILQQITFIHYLKSGTGVKIYIEPADCDAATIAKVLMKILSNKAYKDIMFVIEINIFDSRNTANMYRSDLTDEQRDTEFDSWKFWNELHMKTNYSNQIEVALVINSNLPSDDTLIYRWLAETVDMLVIPHNSFITNKSNYPIMTKRHQDVIRKFLSYTTNSITIEPKSILDNRIDFYIDYIIHQSGFVNFNEHSNYRDSLRYPLQPLYDNLDNMTYEVFEKDPAKYILYQRAIEAALIDMVSENDKSAKTIILMIVGCGRGPLIRAALNASENTKRKIKILAVEKNPGAIVVLKCMIRDLWSNKDITLISKDMRNMELEEKVDIIVSELMGSFGDNELSPECLDGVQHLLKPTGISIPQNSKSYLQPIMNKRIYGIIQKKSDNHNTSRSEYSEPTEINWLSYMSNIFHIDEVKELFTFVHPNKDVPIDNSRNGTLLFKSEVNCVLHGFAGYFTSQLYKDIEISIHPLTHTKGMGSWYSMFFPISKIIQLNPNDEIEIEFWRKIDTKKVWYEWRVNKPIFSNVHNANGDIHPIWL